MERFQKWLLLKAWWDAGHEAALRKSCRKEVCVGGALRVVCVRACKCGCMHLCMCVPNCILPYQLAMKGLSICCPSAEAICQAGVCSAVV